MADISPLLNRLPSLQSLPHVHILDEATPVQSMEKLNHYYRSKNIAADIWVKRDDQSFASEGK